MSTRILGSFSTLFLVPLLLAAQGTQPSLRDAKILWEFDTGG